MAFIDIDYQDTLQKAAQLENLAAELRRVSTHDLAELQSCRNWRGSAAEVYKKKTKILSQQVNAQANDLQKLASSLRQAAERYRWLEQVSHSIFGG